jgi:allophanate hydrolase subunit 2
MFASKSTYLPAGLGGHGGRSLQGGYVIPLANASHAPDAAGTPEKFRPPMHDRWMIRACRSFETDQVDDVDKLFGLPFDVGGRSDRMGIKLEGTRLDVRSDGCMPSAPVFPGTIQCPEDGEPFLLSVDAQTTGGYPRVAKVTRADRHLLGQLRPGNTLTLLLRTDEEALVDLRHKHTYWRDWLPDIANVI